MPKVTFIERNGNPRTLDVPAGKTLLEAAHMHKIDLEGACDHGLACATCHVVVDPLWAECLPPPKSEELDMLDLAPNLQKTSRLGCQIRLTEALDGLVVTLPPA